MKNSKELLVRANIIPKLRLAIKEEGKAPKPTGPHRVKILEDKIQRGKDHEGKIIDIVRYTFEENNEKKRYDVPVKNKEGELHYLVQRLSEFEEGQEIIIEMKKKGAKNYVSVTPVESSVDVEVDENEHVEVEEMEEDSINI